jgi:membrane protein
MGTVGLLLLVATALAMMLTIDRTLNAIWRVRRPRPWRSACWSTGPR